jgi:two-component system chemotaxis sensor kinase CheA
VPEPTAKTVAQLVPEVVQGVVEGAPRSTAAATASASAPAGETTIRLNVTLLDSLMTLAGELVLSRNQLNESLARQNVSFRQACVNQRQQPCATQ